MEDIHELGRFGIHDPAASKYHPHTLEAGLDMRLRERRRHTWGALSANCAIVKSKDVDFLI